MTTTTSDLAIAIPPCGALAFFTTRSEIDPVLRRIREEIDGFHADVGSPAGRKAIASMAYKIARSKTFLDDAGKRLVAEQKEIPNKIDASRRLIRETLDAWRDEVRGPLDAWEAAENERRQRHVAAVDRIRQTVNQPANSSATEIRQALDRALAVSIDPAACEEFMAEYAVAKDAAVTALTKQLAERERYEAEQAELARLRAAEQQRHKEEAGRRAAEAAAAKAKRDAEDRAAAEHRAAEAAAQRERDAAARREHDLKRLLDEATAREKEAAARTLREAEAKAARKADEDRKRKEDADHRTRVHAAVRASLLDGGLDEEASVTVLNLLIQGRVPHVAIHY